MGAAPAGAGTTDRAALQEEEEPQRSHCQTQLSKNAKREEKKECPVFSLSPTLPPVLPKGQIYPEATGYMILANAVCRNQPGYRVRQGKSDIES